jgi:hypothetical protein
MTIADHGYFNGEEILACEAAGVTPLVMMLRDETHRAQFQGYALWYALGY